MARPRLRLVAGDESRGGGRGGQNRKSLEQHIADATFEARKHEELLDEDELVDDPVLRKLQQRFRRLKAPAKRREASLEFEREVRVAGPERREGAEAKFQGTSPTAREAGHREVRDRVLPVVLPLGRW